MIEECNFKTIIKPMKITEDFSAGVKSPGNWCDMTGGKCKGEDKCILYQIYKNTVVVEDYKTTFGKFIVDSLLEEKDIKGFNIGDGT